MNGSREKTTGTEARAHTEIQLQNCCYQRGETVHSCASYQGHINSEMSRSVYKGTEIFSYA
jgi:hypothetical protein